MLDPQNLDLSFSTSFIRLLKYFVRGGAGSSPGPGLHFSANPPELFWAPGRAVFGFFHFFSDLFGTGARLGPDFGPLSLQTLIFDGL